MTAPYYPSYAVGGQTEQCLAFGADYQRQILIVPPLFDEMNRVRRMLVEMMRALNQRGVGSLLIDLPGCNESLVPLETQDLNSWRAAVSSCAQQWGATHIASLRGGALIDDGPSLPHWRLAPAKGSTIVKTLIRMRIAGDKEAGRDTSEAALMDTAARGPLDLGGIRLGPSMIAALANAAPFALPELAERKLGEEIIGSPLWLRAEPQDDATMSASIAEDLDRWSASCGG